MQFMESKSPLDQILSRSDFKPFAGPRAFTILKLAKSMLQIPPVEEKDVLKAVSSLSTLLETEVAMIYAMQDFICIKCGDCCRNRGSIRISKQELKNIADYKKKSYKQIKVEIRAVPLGDGTLRVRQRCKFLVGNNCSIYSVRPATCQNYPASEIIKNLANGGGDDPCPIDDQLLAEILVKRVFEERLFKEDPKEYKKMVEQRQRDLANFANLSSHERLNRLASSYRKYLQEEANPKNS